MALRACARRAAVSLSTSPASAAGPAGAPGIAGGAKLAASAGGPELAVPLSGGAAGRPLARTFAVVAGGVLAPARRACGWRGFAADASETRVKEPKTSAEYRAILKLAAKGLTVTDFSATWCTPCKIIAPVFHKMSLEHPGVTFIKVDVDDDELREVVHEAEVSAVPMFVFFKDGAAVETMKGADAKKLAATVARLAV